METCPGQCLISYSAQKETLIYLQRTRDKFPFSMHLKRDNGKFIYIIMYIRHFSLFFFLPCYQTLKLKLYLQMTFSKPIEFSSRSSDFSSGYRKLWSPFSAIVDIFSLTQAPNQDIFSTMVTCTFLALKFVSKCQSFFPAVCY